MSARVVFRTLFYQFFLLSVGLAIGFIINAEYVGWKAHLVNRSIKNIFYPVEMDDELCRNIKQFAAHRIWCEIGQPKNFIIIEEGLAAEEFYIAKVSYLNENNREVIDILSTRVRWKPWEYYYTDPTPWTEEQAWDYIENGTLNSKETDKALKLRKERQQMNKEKIRI